MFLVSKFLRGSAVESFHVGYAVIVDEKDTLLFAAGEPDYPVFIRSAAKPFQAVAVLEAGAMEKYKFSEEELAVMCASHNGEHFHVDAVSSMLKKIDLTIDHLKCGVHPPLDRQIYEQLAIQGRRPTALHNNCSGKHAGMLALAKILGANLENYLDSTHPVQQKIFEKIKYYSGKERIPVGVDGCNAPTFLMPLRAIAGMYRKLIAGQDDYLRKVQHAMITHPKYVGGRARFDTDFMTLLGGRGVAKIGSEGVRGIGLRTEEGNTIGIAIKVLSGNWEACDSMSVAVLKHNNLIDEETAKKLEHYASPTLRSHTEAETGKIVTDINAE